MLISKRIDFVLALYLACLFNTQTSLAFPTSIESDFLVFNYDTDNLLYVGEPEAVNKQLLFNPSLSLAITGQTTNDPSPINLTQPFAALFNVQAKPGFKINGYKITASGSLFGGGSTQTGVLGSFNVSSSGASGLWSAEAVSPEPLPTLSFSGELSVFASNFYSFVEPAGFIDVPVYETVAIDDIVGYEPIYDEFGNVIGETPIIITRNEDVLIGYDRIFSFITAYQVDAGDISLDRISIDFNVSAIPLPSAGFLFLIGLAGAGLIKRVQRG